MTSAPTATFTITEETRVRTGLSRLLLSRDGLFVAVLLLLVLVACLFVPRFASPVTTGYLLLNAMPALLIALPMTLIIITGEIDLSVASIVAMSTVTVGTLTTAGWPFGAAAAAAIVVGLIAGWLGGLVMKGSGYGLVGDIVVGILGGVVGAWLFIFLVPIGARDGLVGTVFVALIGAAVFVAVARVLTRRTVHA